jgi:hypothetical protein
MNKENTGWYKHLGEGPKHFSHEQVKNLFEEVFQSSLKTEE